MSAGEDGEGTDEVEGGIDPQRVKPVGRAVGGQVELAAGKNGVGGGGGQQEDKERTKQTGRTEQRRRV